MLRSYSFIFHRGYITPKIERFFKWRNKSAMLVQVRKSQPTDRSLTSQLLYKLRNTVETYGVSGIYEGRTESHEQRFFIK